MYGSHPYKWDSERTTIVQKGPTFHGRRTMIQTSQLTVHHGTSTFLAPARKDHIRTCLHHDLIFVKNHTACAANMQPRTRTQSEIHYVVIYIHNWTLKDHNLGRVQRWIFCWPFLLILHSHDSLLGVHEYWQWNHILQRSRKGLERLPFQFPLFESRADIRKFVHLQTCYSVIMIHYSNLRALSFSQNRWPLTHNGNYICCLYQNSIDWVDECLNDRWLNVSDWHHIQCTMVHV